MKKKPFVVFGLLSLSALVFAGCTTQSELPQSETTPQVVKIGVIAPLSGPAANYGADAQNMYKYITDRFNAENIGKIQIELVVEDGKCEGKDAASAAQKLINVDKVSVIIGGICSSETIPAGEIAQTHKTVLLSPLSDAPAISEIGDYVFRFYNTSYATVHLVEYLKQKGANKLFVLSENTPSCVGYLDSIEKLFVGTVEKALFQPDEKDFLMLIKQLKPKIESSDFFIFLPHGDGNAINIVSSLDQEGILESMKGKLISNELINSTQVIETHGEKLDGIQTTQLKNLDDMGSKTQSFIKEYLTTHAITSDPFWIVFEAEAISLVLDAIKNGKDTSEEIKSYFNSFSEYNKREGYFGNYYFTKDRDAYGIGFLVYELENGKLINGK